MNLNQLTIKEYQSQGIKGLIPYEKGSLLAVVADDTADGGVHHPQKEEGPKIMIFSPEKDELQAAAILPQGEFGGFAYHNQNLYYYGQYGIYKQPLQGEGEKIGDFSKAAREYGEKAWVIDQNYYGAASRWDGLYIKKIASGTPASLPLVIQGGGLRNVNDIFMERYPDVALVEARDTSAFQTTQGIAAAIQGGDGSVDLFHISTEEIDFYQIMKKEFAYPLQSREIIRTCQGSMYPYIQQGTGMGDDIYGVLTYIGIPPTVFCSLENFEQGGFTKEDLPATYMDFLDLYIRWMEEKWEEHPDLSFMYQAFTKEHLMIKITRMYVELYEKRGEIINFDTPLYRRLVAKADQVVSLQEELGLAHYDYWTENDWQILFEDMAGHLFGMETTLPLLLPMDQGQELARMVYGELFFINPLSQNKERALDYLEILISQYDDIMKLSIYPHETKPIEEEGYQERIENLEGEIEQMEIKREGAQGEEKGAIKEKLEIEQQELARVKQGSRWYVPPEQVAFYQQNLPAFFMPRPNSLYAQWETREQASNIVKLLTDYADGTLTLDQLISEANRRAQMAAAEGK